MTSNSYKDMEEASAMFKAHTDWDAPIDWTGLEEWSVDCMVAVVLSWGHGEKAHAERSSEIAADKNIRQGRMKDNDVRMSEHTLKLRSEHFLLPKGDGDRRTCIIVSIRRHAERNERTYSAVGQANKDGRNAERAKNGIWNPGKVAPKQ